MGNSIGVLEVYGTAKGFEAAEACYQAQGVAIESLEIGRLHEVEAQPSGMLIRVAVRGSRAAVKQAVLRGAEIAQLATVLRYNQVYDSPVIDV